MFGQNPTYKSIRQLVNGQKTIVPSIIDDPAALPEIAEILKGRGMPLLVFFVYPRFSNKAIFNFVYLFIEKSTY